MCMHTRTTAPCSTLTGYSGFEVTCPDCDLKSALDDHAARDKLASWFVISYSKFELREHSREECSRNSNFEYIMTNYDEL